MKLAWQQPSELAAEFAAEPLLVVDSERVRFANQAFADLVGVPRAEIEGKGVDQIITVLDEPMVSDRLRNAIRQGQPFRGEAACHTASGGAIPVDLSVIPVVSEDETIYVVSALDRRHQKQLEHQLWQSQRLDAVTQLADGIDHEMNNVLQVISGYSKLFAANPTRPPEAEEIGALAAASRRAHGLLTELLDFAKRRPAARVATDLNRIIAQWEVMLDALIGADIRQIVDLGSDLPTILADRTEVQQILINLVTNARDAMPDGGTLTITTHAVSGEGGLDGGTLDERAGRYVVLSVADTGIGMSPETKAKLFQPFFSTKGAIRGLGLVTVQEIVRETGGLVWVRSQEGVGTTVEVHFPALGTPVAIPASRAGFPAVHHDGQGSEIILLVDDDPLVLKVTQRALAEFGYRVLAAGSAAEATTLAAERGAEISMLITDVMMPGQRGTGLAEELVADHPHLRILFISGYPEAAGPVDESARPRVPYLTKPFSPEELAHAVRTALDA